MNKKLKEKTVEEKKKYLLEAKESFQKMQEEIAPFIRPRRRFEEHSTAGEWHETSSLYYYSSW